MTLSFSDDKVKVELRVPENPTALDLLTAYLKQVQTAAELADEEIIPAELDVANAQRIAVGKRARADRLHAQVESLRRQFDVLDGLRIAAEAAFDGVQPTVAST